MLVNSFLTSSARLFPDKIALVCDGERFTYRELDDLSTRLAVFLSARGLHRGDRVAICLENSPAAVISIFGALKAGGAFMFINPGIRRNKLDYLLSDSQAAVLIAHEEPVRWVPSFLTDESKALSTVISVEEDHDGRGGSGVVHWETALSEVNNGGPLPRLIDLDLASLIYTSGSTGKPKAAVLSHRNMITAADSITQYLDNRQDDVVLNVLPLSFDYGLYQVLMTIKFGGRIVLERSFNYPSSVLNVMVEEEVTGFPGVPTVFMIMNRLEGFSQKTLPALRFLTNTGAALPTRIVREIRQRFPNADFYSMYGLTECKRVSFLPPDQIDRIPASVGKAMPNVETWIVKEDGPEALPGEVGELVVRGSNVMLGYWNDPEATEAILKKGRHNGEKVLMTGDLFRADKDGYLYFVGRKDDIIKSRGEKVSPREVEDVLLALPGVLEAAVVGVGDDLLGTMIVAHLVTDGGNGMVPEREVLRHCSDHLENFMVPGKVIFRDTLPKTASGKIDRVTLSKEALSRRIP